MNYYERHLGDYSKDTAHLTMIEHGAYTLLMDRYYSKERGIPENEAYRVALARTKAEKTAVDYVLKEFFTLIDGLWKKGRIEEEIKKYLSGEPERIIKKENENNRIKRHREERSNLFRILTEHGLHANWNIGITELRELVKPLQQPLPATAPATLATATQTPDTRHQTPVLTTSTSTSSVGRPEPPSPETTDNATRKGNLCKKLRSLGIDAAPHLEAWPELLAGYADDEILAVAEKARDKNPGKAVHLNYLVPMLKDRAKPKPTKREAPWWSSNEMMLAKGKTLNMEPRPGESYPEFRGRIDARLNEEAPA